MAGLTPTKSGRCDGARVLNRRMALAFTALVVVPLAVGTAVYVGWRSTTILVFDGMALVGIPADVFRPSVELPRTILYSLPDGCWVFAGTAWMLLIWRRIHPWVFAIAVIALAGEFAQALGWVRGTFEWNDVVFYLGGFVLALIGHAHAQTLLISDRCAGHGSAGCGNLGGGAA